VVEKKNFLRRWVLRAPSSVPHHVCGAWIAACYAAADVHTPHGIVGQASSLWRGVGAEGGCGLADLAARPGGAAHNAGWLATGDRRTAAAAVLSECRPAFP
jgi:hypothetical protein